MSNKDKTLPRILDESKAAAALGLRTFISQTPCKKEGCGAFERRVAAEGQTGCICVACDRRRSTAYRAANREACNARTNKWRSLEENKQYLREHSRAHKERKRLKELSEQVGHSAHILV